MADGEVEHQIAVTLAEPPIDDTNGPVDPARCDMELEPWSMRIGQGCLAPREEAQFEALRRIDASAERGDHGVDVGVREWPVGDRQDIQVTAVGPIAAQDGRAVEIDGEQVVPECSGEHTARRTCSVEGRRVRW